MYLHIKAPFAAFRCFQSGSFRSTTPIPSPSAVYGLLLNLAGIEQRSLEAADSPLERRIAPAIAADEAITRIKPKDELPQIKIAIAQVKPSETAVLSQQLHTYPVGDSGKKDLAPRTHGAKYWIVPIRRQILIDLELIVGIKAEASFCDRLTKGLNGELNEPRYGLPFAGDNNFLIDEIKILEKPDLARWYCQVDNDSPPSRDKCRLTTWIDRVDNTKTETKIFGYKPSNYVLEPPDEDNIWVSLP